MSSLVTVLDPILSWNAIIQEAKRWQVEDIGCTSTRRGKQYTITEVKGAGPQAVIHIEREAGHQPSDLGFRRVRDFLGRFGGQPTMRANRSVHRVDVAIVTVIVHLHPNLTFSPDGGLIEVLLTPKYALPGARMVNPSNFEDQQALAREIRRGQPKFRAELMKAYGAKCCVTGTAVEEVLDAAHIVPYAIVKSNQSTNGLLLRSDIHNLFDSGLIKIDPIKLLVHVCDELNGSNYMKYHNAKIASRVDLLKPDQNALSWHYKNV